MKKLLVLLFLMAIGTSVYGQKSYVNVCVSKNLDAVFYQNISLTGDIPSGIKDGYDSTDRVTIGQLLNMLSQKGYEVEFMSSNGNDDMMIYLLSKKTSSNQTQIEGDVNQDGEVTISDVNKVINIILGIVRENPELLEKYGIELPK